MAERKIEPEGTTAEHAAEQAKTKESTTKALKDRPLKVNLARLEANAAAGFTLAELAASQGCDPERLWREYREVIESARLRGRGMVKDAMLRKAVVDKFFPALRLLFENNCASEREEREQKKKEEEERRRAENPRSCLYFDPRRMSGMNPEQLEQLRLEWEAERKKLQEPIVKTGSSEPEKK